MNSPKITFLVYDSRSGSTLLARKISEALPGVSVTPEIGFDSLLKQRDNGFSHQQITWLVAKLFDSGDFRNIGLNQHELLRALKNLAEPVSQKVFIETTLKLWLQAYAPTSDHVVIKNGTHIKYWPQIFRMWNGNTRMLHICRDPRAVINSKLRTMRPYHPHESMAWGGPLVAAIRWKSYFHHIRAAQAAGVNILNVRYENLITAPAGEITHIAEFLDAKEDKNKPPKNYDIPAAERNIHQLVSSGKIEASRSEAWQHELARKDCKIIEAVCGTDMVKMGYALSARIGHIGVIITILRAIPDSLMRISRHYLRRSKE